MKLPVFRCFIPVYSATLFLRYSIRPCSIWLPISLLI
ncbi:hypothetical protein BMETH_1557_0 [methanotrophic bacterial endosymbiont of Bathymodiolus sp.]|nr:hypothetical protein BMETH_1557_0 [methanotrophic bacterial endosymbiont of Bathymodiolus sp.]